MTPTVRARLTGVVYLLFFIAEFAGTAVMPIGVGPGGASGNAASLASAISSHRSSYLLGAALGVVAIAFYVLLTGLFYVLFRPVSKTLALLAVLSSLIGCAVGAVGTIFLFAPVRLLSDGSLTRTFGVEQVQALAMQLVHLYGDANRVALVFFGVFQLLLGYLIFRSGFLPPVLGVLIAVAGAGWLTVLVPPLVSALGLYTEVLGALAEVLLMLWLLLRGVNATRWNVLVTEAATQPSAS